MPVTVTGTGRTAYIEGVISKYDSPGLIMQLGYSLATILLKNAPIATGAAASAISEVGEPERIMNGWAITVGNKSKTGLPQDSAPTGTLRAFFDYLEGTGRVRRYTDWWGLSRENKTLLEQGRRAGMFGGRGADYANYIWVQNYGNAKAGITGTHFIERSLAEFRKEASRIIGDYRATKP